MTALSDQAALFGVAARAVSELVTKISHADGDVWDGPGLGEWDLRALVGHTSRSLITVETYLDQPAEREELATPEAYIAAGQRIVAAAADGVAQRGRDAGQALGPRPAEAFAELVERVLPLVDRDDDPMITTIAGGMRLSVYLPTRVFELVVHGTDIADALGVDPPAFPPEVWSAALTLATRAAVLSGQSPALLRAVTGRAPLPPDFSVV